MPEADLSTLVILLCACVGLLALILLSLIRVGGFLRRIERRLEGGATPDAAAPAPGAAETAAGGAFESFLNEDPARRKLSKSEQFAAYRRWRQENGLNWSNS
jgi:hypothetical protein